ncbi:MAG: hypothetical protein D9V45_12885 [Chloroflexi bacterium]|nr:MAG: hypothetical protein D9V45_12885 [Chloroflexota bacterium]
MKKNSKWLKDWLLSGYREKDPHIYYQFDGRIRPNRDKDEELETIVITSAAFELIDNARVRVLIAPEVTQVEALLLLKDIRKMIRLEGFREAEASLWAEMGAIEQGDLELAAELQEAKNEPDKLPF